MFGSVSIEDLSNELQRHNSSPDVMRLLDQLRKREIDLREFCRRVRMLLGSDVLMATVKGLQQSQNAKKAADGASPRPPPPQPIAAGPSPVGVKQEWAAVRAVDDGERAILPKPWRQLADAAADAIGCQDRADDVVAAAVASPSRRTTSD